MQSQSLFLLWLFFSHFQSHILELSFLKMNFELRFHMFLSCLSVWKSAQIFNGHLKTVFFFEISRTGARSDTKRRRTLTPKVWFTIPLFYYVSFPTFARVLLLFFSVWNVLYKTTKHMVRSNAFTDCRTKLYQNLILSHTYTQTLIMKSFLLVFDVRKLYFFRGEFARVKNRWPQNQHPKVYWSVVFRTVFSSL